MHMEEAANLISSLQQTLSEVDTVVANVNERSKRTILQIEIAAQRLVETIIEHRHKLVSKVCEITEAKLHALQTEKEIVQENFRAVENVLRCAQNTGAVEDSDDWENAVSRQLGNLKGVVFDFQEYNEDLEFHFLYRDENLLAAICNFGDVFTVPNDGDIKVASHDAEPAKLRENTKRTGDGKSEFENATDSVSLLQEFQENFNIPDQTTEKVQEIDFERTVLTRLFEETVDGTQLIEDKNECKELSKDEITSTLEQIEEDIGDSCLNDKTDDETVQNCAVLKQNWSDCSTPFEHLVSTTEEVEVSLAVDNEISSIEQIEHEIKDLNNNNDKNNNGDDDENDDKSVIAIEEDSFST